MLAGSAASVLWIARWLTPVSSGIGTHTQLGLPPCPFHAATGLPCPGCGLTTAFARLAHGDWSGAWAAHALGPLLFLVTVALVPASLVGMWRAWPLDAWWHRSEVGRGVHALAWLWALSWLWRLAEALR